MFNELELGDVRVGRVFASDLDSDRPDQAATLRRDEHRGIELLVPHFKDSERTSNPQYGRTRAWFSGSGEDIPASLLFQDHRGVATLVGLRFGGAAGLGACLGTLRPQTVILGQPRELREEYRVAELGSSIDGLAEFARFRPIGHSRSQDAGGKGVTTVTICDHEEVAWDANGFRYAITSRVRWTAQEGTSFIIDDARPLLRTSSDTGVTPSEHLVAQWPVRALLTLVHGRALQWRAHQLLDDEFPQWTLGGSELGLRETPVLFARTAEQHAAPACDALEPSALILQEVGAEGMRRWADLYVDEDFRRAVQPAVEVFHGATSFLEPQAMMLAMALDRMGQWRFGDGKRRAMWETILRCLDAARLEWPRIGSRIGIAKAIANANNDLKHPGRPTYPEQAQLVGVTRLAKVIMRAQLFDLLGVPEDRMRDFLRSNDAHHAEQAFLATGITISDEGHCARV